MSTNHVDLTLEFRFTTGSSMEFHETDPSRVDEILGLLAAPRLFAQPQLILASQHSASLIPCKGIDMILVRTSAPLPIKFPLDIPAGRFDIFESGDDGATGESPAVERENLDGSVRRRDLMAEIHTYGGWNVALKAVAMFNGNVQDERQFFLLLPNLPTIPFRLKDQGFGLINNGNILRVTASPRPESLPPHVLPLEVRH